MANILRQSTAVDVLIGPFVDSTDGYTAETGVSPSVKLSKNGQTLAAKNDATTPVHDADGYYNCELDATDTNTVGNLVLTVVGSATSLPVRHEFQVVEENVYDAFYGASGALGTDIASILADTGTDGVAISSSTLNSIADSVWDESAASHVSAGSFGASAFNQVIRSNTAQAGASTTITLDASASATDDFYNNTYIYIVSGTGVGQGRFITDYVGSTKVATVDTWVTNPDATSVFTITPFGTLPGSSAPTAAQVADAVWDEATADHTTTATFGEALGGSILRTATAQAGASTTITLDASASATNDIYNYQVIRIISGTGAGQARQISDYVGASKVATVSLAWATNPSSDSVFQIVALGVDAATVASIADGVWDEARAGHVTAGSFGERVNSNVTQISGDTTAADNAESFFDGTGYAGTNNVIPTVTTATNVTNQVSADVTAISGDATAADNLEAALDGTGGVTISGDLAGSVTNVTGGINTAAGTITTLDGLDTAQDTQHSTTQSNIATVDTVVDAIQAKTDSLTFTQAGHVDANVQRINDVTITGDGSATPFDV